MPAAPHVFISYRRDGALNQSWAERIEARLQAEGFPVWRDQTGIEPGQRWSRVIPPALNAAKLVLCVVSKSLLESEWVDAELNHAQQRDLLVVPLQVEAEYEPPFQLGGVAKLDLHQNDERAWRQLLDLVGRHVRDIGTTEAGGTPLPSREQQRDRELEYLDRLLYTGRAVGQLVPLYTELAGVEHQARTLAKALPEDLMPVSFRFRQSARVAEGTREGGKPYSDILSVFSDYEREGHKPRLALLGEPGAGKSFSLRRLTAGHASRALEDATAPVPLLVELGRWTDARLSFKDFIGSEIGLLRQDLDALIHSGRAWLLLDALNEIPTAQQAGKIRQILPWLRDTRLAGLVISCRERDFVGDLRLDMDTLTIEPLDPPRIYLFARRYLEVIVPEKAEEETERFFWRLATGEDTWAARWAEREWREWRESGHEDFGEFWYRNSDRAFGTEISALGNEARGLLRLARNPYLLNILLGLHLNDRLPAHGQGRASIFAAFVNDLLARERERYRKANAGVLPPGEEGLLAGLGALAWSLQHACVGRSLESVQTTMPLSEVEETLSPVQLKHAAAASLIEVKGCQVGFTHQLLQEYFAALGLKTEIDNGRSSVRDLWPAERWWQRKGWEEVANTLAGLYAEDPEPLIAWFGGANPDVLADALVANGLAAAPRESLKRLSRDWLARMTDPEREPNPEARAALGRAVGKLDLDDRRGVGLRQDGLPDIDWVEIPGGEFLYGEEKELRELPTFWIARYPVTNAQYQAFIDAGGYREERWWQGPAERTGVRFDPEWREPNRPSETVSWYEAMAFCRWLSDVFRYEVRLPKEEEWEKAARGSDGRVYPWGDEYVPGFANVDEKISKAGPTYLEQTTAVGLYPQGASPYGVLDLAGNVWEWCLNEYEQPDRTDPGGDARRVLRGGSWFSYPELARASLRGRYRPDSRDDDSGFRVVCWSPSAR